MARHWCNPPTTKPKQREYLKTITDRIERDAPHLVVHIAALRALEEQMYNRVPAHRARAQSQPMSPTTISQIYYWRAVDPFMPQHVISARVGINQGRVNEVLRGIRV